MALYLRTRARFILRNRASSRSAFVVFFMVVTLHWQFVTCQDLTCNITVDKQDAMTKRQALAITRRALHAKLRQELEVEKLSKEDRKLARREQFRRTGDLDG